MIKNILLTGPAEAGKTVLVRKLSEIFKEFNPSGFFTVDINEDGIKKGALIASLFGDAQVFYHTGLKSRYSVGKFGIDMKGFENLLENVFSKDKKTSLYIIDEIGKMECRSRKFGKLIVELLNSEKPVIATIAEKGTGLVSDLKKRSDVKLIGVAQDNHELILKELTMEIRDLLLD